MRKNSLDPKTAGIRRISTIGLVSLASFALAAFPSAIAAASPENPGAYGTAAANAQCGTFAESGSFNARNLVFGPNSSAFGQSGGAGGGQTGINNSAVCGNR